MRQQTRSNIIWVLREYRKLKEAKRNAELSLHFLRMGHNPTNDVNRFIQSNKPGNPVESGYLAGESAKEKTAVLNQLIFQLEDILTSVDRAIGTLNEDQKRVVGLRYFEDKPTAYIQDVLGVSSATYYRIHQTAVDDLLKCLFTKFWTRGYLEGLRDMFMPEKNAQRV